MDIIDTTNFYSHIKNAFQRVRFENDLTRRKQRLATTTNDFIEERVSFLLRKESASLHIFICHPPLNGRNATSINHIQPKTKNLQKTFMNLSRFPCKN